MADVPGLPLAQAWALLTRLGEAQIVVPPLLVVLVAWWWRQRRLAVPLLLTWLIGLALTASLTLASKLVFIGWGLGWAWADYTGVSGHAMVASATLPPLLALLCLGRDAAARRTVLALAVLLVLGVGVSRVVLGAHSVSEVVAGWALGATVAGGTLRQLRLLHAGPRQAARWPAVLVLAWSLLGVSHVPPSRSHDLVTALALGLSGHATAHVRADLHRPAAAR